MRHTHFVDEMPFEVLWNVLQVAISLIVTERIELWNSWGGTDGGPEGSDILITSFRLEAIGSAGIYQWWSVSKKFVRSTRILPKLLFSRFL